MGYLRNHLFVLQEIKPILQFRYIPSAREKTNSFAIYLFYQSNFTTDVDKTHQSDYTYNICHGLEI